MHRSTVVLSSMLLALAGTAWAALVTPPLWRDVKAASIPLIGPRLTTPVAARTFSMDYSALRASLAKAPAENAKGKIAAVLLELPLPDGSTTRFRIVETAVMSPALAAKYPDIKTYAGTAVGDALTTGRFDVGPRGFHGQIFTPRGTIYIDPFSRGDVKHYQAYYRKDLRRRGGLPGDQVIVPPRQKAAAAQKSSLRTGRTGGRGVDIAGDLRTYRLALAANGEYSQFVDPDTVGPAGFPAPDIALVLAELVNVTNRVTGVYERELGIRLQLVDENDQLIYQYAQLDPYANDNGIAMLEVNTTVINGKIGNAAYDIGHVVSTGGGGVAGLGVVCNRLMKGAGVTGLTEPVGDGFYIDYVAHEMGHQFGGNHTFNSETGSCSGNGNPDTAYEPGSGVTIMAYAGICGTDNVEPHSIDTFHATSFDEIVAYTREDEGNDCAVVTTTSNHPPVADAGTGGFTIPKLTPFELTGSGSDPDGDPITFQWEQMDLGAFGSTEAPDATAPLFRSFLPTTSPTRSFPQVSDLAGNVHTIGELLPAVARALNFRLTVRDNRTTAIGTAAMPEAGGVSSADLQFNVADTGPFLLTVPNNGGTYKAGVPFDVSWDVAGTDVAPISCAAVDLLLSIDGGLSFPFTLATAQPNDGVQSVTLPGGSGTDTARIKVLCASSIFFDVSDTNFTIVNAPPVVPVTPTTPTTPTPAPNTPVAPPPVVAPPAGTALTHSSDGGRFGGSLPLLATAVFFAAALRRRRHA